MSTDSQNVDLQRLVRSFLDDPELGPAFRTALRRRKCCTMPGLAGLLEHVVFLLRLCERVWHRSIADEVDPDLLMTAAILHDMGKVRELAWKSSFSYTTEGQLLGHITIVIGMLREKVLTLAPFPERLRILVEHMILSHHGRFEYGSPKLPMTPEALLFSALDDLEAKMQNVRAEFAKAVESGKRHGRGHRVFAFHGACPAKQPGLPGRGVGVSRLLVFRMAQMLSP